ncbi:efflux RND transporter periplasmic adaptor subunit [Novosphingobium album (ex Hu et al. 2023)]|uniref:Efflux RND transporter periplasmic adaptor subunit n=1 Tax=Novosphingobium album (ex Hu et al. 2023) TaxID=2930093 RepID=A0ABT0AZR8_9SPHN|nr:efflux RND transporter periplasmic adaptor subunit [Novosphingobium album (ex Hu et al. 2023)]MCJ2178296.1 efflux RND transporter periplasmic adaptor subunit [Novosphingobium album (ex Hu et al. 2023)]
MTEETLDEFLGVKPKPAWRRHGKWAGAVAVVLILILLLARCFGGTSDAGYITAKAQTGRLITTVSATGQLAPTNQVTVGSQLSGQIVKVLVDVNDRVTAGQPLAEIDPEQYDDAIRQNEAQLQANKAAVEQARATLAEAQAQLARLEEVSKLSGGKVPSGTELQAGRADLLRARAALDVARANVVASEATLAQSRTQRARAIIRSPVSGVVLAREIDPGQTVAASLSAPTLFVIAEDLAQMKLEVSIDEADVGSVKEGQKASFTVDAFPGKTFPATITRVDIGSNQSVSSASSSSSSSTSSSSSSSSSTVVSYAADLAVANPDGQLRPGMTATADIVTSDKSDILLVPNAALRFTPQSASASSSSNAQSGGITGALSFGPPRRQSSERSATIAAGATQTVWVLGEDGKPKAVQIVTGETNGSETEVLSGDLKAGMQVITGERSTSANTDD